MKKNKKPEIVVTCAKCGEKYMFNTLKELDYIDINTPCRRCGFFLFKHLSDKMQATLELLQEDMYAGELLKQGKIKEFDEYLTFKKGIKYPNKTV